MKIINIISASILIIASSAAVFSNHDRFSKKTVAVIPVENRPGEPLSPYNQKINEFLRKALIDDGRFEFVDERLIPVLLKEMERRQLGLSKSNDSPDPRIRNVDYIITVELPPWGVTPSPTNGITLSVTYVQEGGRVRLYTEDAAAWYYEEKKIVSNLQNQQDLDRMLYNRISTGLSFIFPLEAPVKSANMRSVVLGRGASSGAAENQIYQVRQYFTDPGSGYTLSRPAALAKVSSVSKEESRAVIIYGDLYFDTENTIAAEQQRYSNAFYAEVYGGPVYYNNIKNYDAVRDDHETHGYTYGLKVFQKYMKHAWGFIYSQNTTGGDRTIRVSFPDYTARYNAHIFRRLFAYLDIGAALEWAVTETNLRSEKPRSNFGELIKIDSDGNYVYEDKINVSGIGASANAGLGLRFVINGDLYLFSQINYTAAPDYFYWSFKKKSIDNYTEHIKLSPGGPSMRFGLGFSF